MCREMSLHSVTGNVIEMWNGRSLIEFQLIGDGMYSNDDGLSLSSRGDGITNCLYFYNDVICKFC